MKEKYCSACGQDIKPGEMSVRCRLCMSNYHSACWEKSGGCSTDGCGGKPDFEKGDERLERKRCPNCGEKVVGFAVKCRYCRTVLDSEAVGMEASSERKEKTRFRKDPILTCLLNLIFPGAGYMYLGLFNKGVIWFLVAVAAWFFTRGIGLIAVYAWVMYDSARQAVWINRDGPPTKKASVQRR